MFISVINLIILLVSKKTKEDTKYNKVMSAVMVLLTLIIIISSFLRMYMYESAYGYTLLRLLVYITLITEGILLIPTLVYIFNRKINVLKPYMIIIISVYTIVSLLPIDYFIAKNNINRYNKTGKIDVYYLMNDSTDNISLLSDLYYKLENPEDKRMLKIYLNEMKDRNKFSKKLEYNISREKSKKYFEKISRYQEL